MKPIRALLALTALTTSMTAAEIITFDGLLPGASPAGWTATKTGRGEPKWTVEADVTAPSKPHVLRQSGVADYPVAFKTDVRLADGFVEVKFKAVAGEKDQAGGVVWRVQDADNYYVARANAREGNVVLYKMEKGKRSALDIVGRAGGYGVDARVAKNRWHTLRVDFVGQRFKVSLDGQSLFDVEDPTFAEAGRVGLWTKADSETLFDDFAFGPR